MDIHPQVGAAILGAMIAGLFALLVGWIGYKREQKRRAEEYGVREAEWVRGKLLEAYSRAIYYLIKLSISSSAKSTDDKDVRQHYCEAQR
jgi:hypothetical protein